MTFVRRAYLPLITYPQVVDHRAIQATLRCLASMRFHVTADAFEVDLPRSSSGLGDYLISIPGIIQAAEQASRDACERLRASITTTEHFFSEVPSFSIRKEAAGAEPEIASRMARYYELSAVPWALDTAPATDIIHSLVFGSGRPVLVVPSAADGHRIKRLAVAWDGSRVAARALADALPLLEQDGRVLVLSVEGEKPLDTSIADVLARELNKRGYDTGVIKATLNNRSISDAIQDAAIGEGADLLAMGGFGHSRLRDFVLGGATKGILAQLRLPVLLSH